MYKYMGRITRADAPATHVQAWTRSRKPARSRDSPVIHRNRAFGAVRGEAWPLLPKIALLWMLLNEVGRCGPP